MDLSLVLPRSRSFDGPPFPGESHIPALILGILEGRVIVLQHYLCKDTIPAPAVGLREEAEKVSYVKSGQTAWHTDRSMHSYLFIYTSNKKCCIKQLYYQYISHMILEKPSDMF